jgi:predicted dehydrogenase
MPETHILFDPCILEGSAPIRDAAIEMGDYEMYVTEPISEGIGEGLVRRHDAAMNHLRKMTEAGELGSLQEIAARTNLFRRTWADEDGIYLAGIESLFHHEGFIEAARELVGLELVEPMMLYANFLLPGQELSVHTDTPQYRGLSKKQVPEWLLVVMAHSGLFERWRIHIASAVSFFAPCDEGDFILYPDGPNGEAEHVPVIDNTAVALDADTLFHGVQRVGALDADPPPIEIGMHLHWNEDAWEVGFEDREPVAEYPWGELRFSLQWKAHCYEDEAEKELIASHEDDLDLEMVTEMLVDDLRRRDVIGDEVPDDTQLALTLIDTYVQFPD